MTEGTKKASRMLAAQIQKNIEDISGEKVSLDAVESKIQHEDSEGVVNELIVLTKYYQELVVMERNNKNSSNRE